MENLETILAGASIIINSISLGILAYHIHKTASTKVYIPSAGGISYFNLDRAFEK